MTNLRVTFVVLFFIFGYISAQDTLEKACECSQGNKYGCICAYDFWCDANNVIKEDITVKDIGVDRRPEFIQCGNQQICCRHFQPTDNFTNLSKCGGIVETRIASDDATTISKKQYPWLMAIMLRNRGQYEHKCWGSLIHPEVVVTVTHCLKTINPQKLVGDEIKILSTIISSDDHNHEDNERQEKFARKVIFHSPYAPRTLYNDISLILLDSPMSINEFVEPVCLPPPDFQLEEHKKCRVVGWQSTNNTIKYLQKVDVPLIEPSKCQALLRRTSLGARFKMHESYLCAGAEAGRDACLGDGGSPLVCDYGTGEAYQVGIVSWGEDKTCGNQNVPGGYVNVPNFVSWINATLRNNGIDI